MVWEYTREQAKSSLNKNLEGGGLDSNGAGHGQDYVCVSSMFVKKSKL